MTVSLAPTACTFEKEEPPVKRIAYYQGCSLEGLAGEYDLSTRAICRELSVELVPIPDWNCCGSTPAHSYDPLISAALAGRNLAIAAQQGCDTVMTPCPGCLKSLRGAIEYYKNPEQREDFLKVLGMELDGRIKAVSILELLYEQVGVDFLRHKVRRPLTGHVLVPYYGCLLTRPASYALFDDPENPVSMDRLIEATGATAPDFPYKTECCGAAHGVVRNEIVRKLSGRILEMAVAQGAEAIVVACPLCQQNLDLRRGQVDRHWKRKFKLPVVYITQLIGLALGLEPKALGIDKLFVSADCLLREIPPPESAESAVQG
jgi:heterodisulfide reductase subunit B